MLERLTRTRPLALSAVAVVAVEALLGIAGARSPVFSAAALLGPGLALTPLLPESARRSFTATLAAAPALGAAVGCTALITIASVGIPLTGTSCRLALGALVLVGLLVLRGEEPKPDRACVLPGLVLLFALALAGLLQSRVIGGSYAPGNDWAKYLLYADEIRRQGALLIDNPFWMLGVPFREDPGVSSLYGGYLLLSGQPAAVLVHGIWVFGLMGILSTYAFVRSVWGQLPGLLAAVLWAVIPANQDILGWHGLANVAALALLPLVLLYVTRLFTDGLTAQAAAGFALVLVGVAAIHKLTFGVAAVTVGLAVAIGLVGRERRRLVRGALLTAAFVVPLGAGVAYDLITRGRTFGGTPDASAYHGAHVDLGLTLGDLTWPFAITALAALVLALLWVRRDGRLVPLLCSIPVSAALVGYAWIFGVAGHYFRLAYFLPIALVPLVAIALARLLQPRVAVLACAFLAAVTAGFAWVQAANVRDFYSFVNPTSVRALDRLAADLRPREIVTTDRCWSFLSTWLLHTRTLPALEPEDVLPKAELPLARKGRLVMSGTPAGAAFARRNGIRYAVVDPTCGDLSGNPVRPSGAGRPVFVSKRLVVLRLSSQR